MRRVTAGVILSLVVSGCSAGPPIAPPTTVTGTTPTTSTATRSETPRPTVAPSVSRTLDIRPYRARPCELLTSEQQNALSLPRVVDRFDVCSWEKSQPKDSVTVQLLVDLSYVTQVYLESNKENSGSDRKEWVTFEPIMIAGQPAVVLNPTTNRKYSSVLIGTSPKDSIYVSITSEIATTDPRAKAMTIAEQIVGNLAK